MNRNLTEIVFILDMSGSMEPLSADTIGGFNSLLAKQKKQHGRAMVSTILFNDSSHIIHDRTDIRQVAPLTRRDYCPAGCTALLDAVGGAIRHIEAIHRDSRPYDVPEHTLFIITTDGMENASTHYNFREVRQMIEAAKERHWEFLFLGANIGTEEAARAMGIAPDRCAQYHPDAKGTALNFAILGDALCAVRDGQGISQNWSQPIREDFQKREK